MDIGAGAVSRHSSGLENGPEPSLPHSSKVYSGRHRLRRELGAARRQRHRFHDGRIQHWGLLAYADRLQQLAQSARTRFAIDFDMSRHPNTPFAGTSRPLTFKGCNGRACWTGIAFHSTDGKLCGRRVARLYRAGHRSPASAGAATAGSEQASPDRRHDISINSISAAPAQ
jgi:hypothetical protein